MADQNNTELNQQDVFKYIDQELKSGKSRQVSSLLQKTRSSFKLVLLVNLLAMVITVSGFMIVNKIFKDQAYELVGSEKSIKGLEDVLLAELQKKASAELLNKQKELDDIKQRLTDLNSKMDSFKASQEIKLKQQLAEQENKLKQQLQADLKNKSVQEQQEIQKKYEEQLKLANSRIKEESLKQEEEYKKQLEDQKKDLVASQQRNEKDLQIAKNELANAQDEYKKKLEEERLKSQAALKEVSLKLEERQKIDDFYFQVNTLFQNAINYYQKSDYEKARATLNGVKRLYDNKPDDIPVSAIKKDVDMFFISAIGDYLSIKENSGNTESLQQYVLSLKNLSDFSDDLKKGIYNTRAEQANKKLAQLQQQLPQVFEFYSSYSGYQVLMDDLSAQSEYNIANSDFSKKDYSSAAQHYLNILKKYPGISSRETVLNRLSTSLLAGGEDISPDLALKMDQKEIDAKAKVIYNDATRLLENKKYAQAMSLFQNQILQYPQSQFTKDSFKNITQINQELIKLNSVNLDALVRQQDGKASEVFDRAMKNVEAKKFDNALVNFEEILLNYPLSTYNSKSLEQYKKIRNMLTNASPSPRAIDEASAARVMNLAQQSMQRNELNDSLKMFQDLLISYPGTTNTSLAIKQMETIYRSMYQSTNNELAQLKSAQDKEARILYNEATAFLNKNDNRSAAESFARILIRYPLSSLINESVSGMESAWNNILKEQDSENEQYKKDADALYKKALAEDEKENVIKAIELYSQLIIKYPASSYTKPALEYIILNNQPGSTNASADLSLLKEEQSKAARLSFIRASELESQKKYKEATDLYSTIIQNYPLSVYTSDSMKGLQRSLSSLLEEQWRNNKTESQTQTAIFLTKNVGRVIDKVDNEIIIDVFSGNNLDLNDELYIMRKQNEKILFYVGEASISRVSPVMSKALVTKEVGDINIGDLIFMK